MTKRFVMLAAMLLAACQSTEVVEPGNAGKLIVPKTTFGHGDRVSFTLKNGKQYRIVACAVTDIYVESCCSIKNDIETCTPMGTEHPGRFFFADMTRIERTAPPTRYW